MTYETEKLPNETEAEYNQRKSSEANSGSAANANSDHTGSAESK